MISADHVGIAVDCDGKDRRVGSNQFDRSTTRHPTAISATSTHCQSPPHAWPMVH